MSHSSLRCVVATLFLGACHSTPQPSLPATPRAVSDTHGRPARATEGALEPSKDDLPSKGAIDLATYRGTFVDRLKQLTRARTVESPPSEEVSGAEVPHSVVVLKRIGQADSYIVTTVGFGRVSHSSRAPAHVELLAYADQYGPNISKILSSLGLRMHSKANAASPWKEYDTVELPNAEFGLQYFDLRSAGEVEISPSLRVSLLKVIPLSEEEFAKARDNPSGEYDDPNLAARMLQRWRRAIERR